MEQEQQSDADQGLSSSGGIAIKDSISSPDRSKRRCPYCPFSSYYAASLTVHVRRHTGEKPYQCPYCMKVKRFGDRSNMNSHIRRYHKEARSCITFKKSSIFTPMQPRRPIHVMRTSSSLEKLKPIPPKTTMTSHFNYFPLEQMPVISSVYSATEPSSSGVSSTSPINVSESLESPTSVCASEPSPSAVPEIRMTSYQRPMMKLHRRKPTIVRKQVPSSSDDANIFSALRERLLAGRDFQVQSEDENLHALHRENEVIDNISNVFMPESPKHEINTGITPDIEPMLNMMSTTGMEEVSTQPENTEDMYACRHCDIYFKNCVLHTLHMGCHGYDDPFKCNTCGVQCKNVIEFHCHFARGKHNGAL